MKKNIFKLTSFLMAMIISLQVMSCVKAEAKTRISWYKKMTDGACIFYWVDSGVSYSTEISKAEREIEIPSAGYTNNMKMTKTTRKSSSKMDIYQYSDASSNTVARTYSYKANESMPMPASDKDVYNWYWCKIELNKPLMSKKTAAGRVVTVVHEMLHAYGGKDTYSDDQKSSIMYGYSSRTAKGVTSDANKFLNDKY